MAGLGNTSENYSYFINVASSGTYTVKVNYSRWEAASAATGSVKVNGGSSQALNLAYTGGPDNYQDVSFITTLSSGNSTFQIFGGANGYFKSKKVCIQSVAGSRLSAPLFASEGDMKKDIIISPNPNQGEFDVSFYLERGSTASLKVLDVQGRLLEQLEILGHGNHIEKIKLFNELSGIFLVQLKTSKGICVKKTIVVK